MSALLVAHPVNKMVGNTQSVKPNQMKAWWPSKGTIILGGGYWSKEYFTSLAKTFIDLAGRKDGKIIVIPTATNELEPKINSRQPEISITQYQKSTSENFATNYGINNVVVLHTRDSSVANTEKFVTPLRNATCVWIPGGNPDILAKPYRSTLTIQELVGILERGGIIVGDSAGSIVLGSFWTGFLRDSDDIPDFEENGFGILKNVVINAHADRAKNDRSWIRFLSIHPELIGISIDENTAVIIKDGTLTVLGKGSIRLFDSSKDKTKPFLSLLTGQHYDLTK
jgi:cyanophycinase